MAILDRLPGCLDHGSLLVHFSFLPLSSLVVYSLVSCHSDFHPREPHGHTDGSSAAAAAALRFALFLIFVLGMRSVICTVCGLLLKSLENTSENKHKKSSSCGLRVPYLNLNDTAPRSR